MDCSKTINFFSELKRLCDSRDDCEADMDGKEQCPMFEVCNYSLTKICTKDATKVVESLQKWSDEHPKKTYAQDFLEKFPKAQRGSDGTLLACRNAIYGGGCPKIEPNIECCYECWDEQMEE